MKTIAYDSGPLPECPSALDTMVEVATSVDIVSLPGGFAISSVVAFRGSRMAKRIDEIAVINIWGITIKIL